MNLKKFITLLRQTFKEWGEDKTPRLAAALSYYMVFSIPPLLVTVIGIAGLFLGRSAVQDMVIKQVSLYLSPQAADTISGMVKVANTPGKDWLATVIGLLTLLLGASGAFGQLQDSLNTIWEVRPKPNQGWKSIVWKRLFAFLMVGAAGLLMVLSVVLTALLSALSGVLSPLVPGSGGFFQAMNIMLSFLMVTLLFGLIFNYVPDVRIAWKDTWLGATLTALLFIIGRQLIGLYLAHTNFTSTYGAAASIIFLFVFVYYSAQIMFLGAEFTQVYANRHGSGSVPEPHAERVTEAQRRNEGIPHDNE